MEAWGLSTLRGFRVLWSEGIAWAVPAAMDTESLENELPRSVDTQRQPGIWTLINAGACSKQPPTQGGLPGPATLPIGPEVLTLILLISQV